MRGILLAGGTGSRLRPLTDVTNKHLLPVYDRPVIDHALDVFVSSGSIENVCVVSGPEHLGVIMRYLRDGSSRGLDLTYRVQIEAGGIAQAIGLAADWARGDDVIVMLGDNLFQLNPYLHLDRILREEVGAAAGVYAYQHAHPAAYGVIEPRQPGVEKIRRALWWVERIVEKPARPASSWIATGLYAYDQTVFERIRSLVPSPRGELEVTDLNMSYARERLLVAHEVKGFWGDCGSPEGIYQAALAVRQGVTGLPASAVP